MQEIINRQRIKKIYKYTIWANNNLLHTSKSLNIIATIFDTMIKAQKKYNINRELILKENGKELLKD